MGGRIVFEGENCYTVLMPSHTKIFFGLLGSLILSWYIVTEGVLGTGMAFAQATGAAPGGSGSLSTAQLLEKLGLFFNVCIFLMHIILQFVSALIDPERMMVVLSGAGGTNTLLEIWQLSRGITNTILAFMLIFVALYAVINPDGGTAMIKEKIGKFVLAVILVNFSWFFPRVIIDIANVLTATIYQIPSTIGIDCKTTDDAGGEKPCSVIKNVWLYPKLPRTGGGGVPVPAECKSGASTNPNIKPMGEVVCVELAPWDPSINTGHGMLQGLYVNHVRILSLAKVPREPGPADGSWAGIKELGRFFVQFVFAFTIFLAALIPLLAMAAVFVVRLVMIWLTVAFMPFMFIGFVMGDKMGEFNTMNMIFKKFLAAAFLPAAVAIPLVVGILMINAATAGMPCPSGDAKLKFLCEDHGMLIPGVKNLWVLLWNFAAIVIMWLGFFSALKIDTLYASVGGVFKSVGENWFKFGLKAPLALPILPMGSGKNKSILETIGGDAGLAVARNPNLMINSAGKIDFEDTKKQFAAPTSRDSGTDSALARNEGELAKKLGDLTSALNTRDATGAEIQELTNFFRSNRANGITNIKAALQSSTLGDNRMRDPERLDALATRLEEELAK